MCSDQEYFIITCHSVAASDSKEVKRGKKGKANSNKVVCGQLSLFPMHMHIRYLREKNLGFILYQTWIGIKKNLLPQHGDGDHLKHGFCHCWSMNEHILLCDPDCN